MFVDWPANHNPLAHNREFLGKEDAAGFSQEEMKNLRARIKDEVEKGHDGGKSGVDVLLQGFDHFSNVSTSMSANDTQSFMNHLLI